MSRPHRFNQWTFLKSIPLKMYVFLIFAILSFIAQIGYAGDLPCASTSLATTMSNFERHDNTFNTDSGIDPPPYGGYIGPDLWFSFNAPAGSLFLLLEGIALSNPAIAVYLGPCDDLKLIYNVLDNNCDGAANPNTEFTDLTAGQEYFIRIWPENGSANGDIDVRLTQDISAIVEFSTFGDAVIIDDCVRLTDDVNSQSGCAWFQEQIDFTQPFIHSMSANFGNNNAGADGICLIYQSNGPDICGLLGGGIGALDMPNSAIFEFDTWQNAGEYNDPPDDHTSFNINGDMDHINNIEGPVEIGNIEDGQNHEIIFEWNPVGNMYEVSFDGAVVLSGSYDIVGNCFGGNNMAYWGYTSATGGANNEHVICPELTQYEAGTQSYEEITICEGQDYNGHTDDGFYVDLVPGTNECMHQNNYLLNVIINPPIFIDTVLCFGSSVEIEGQQYDMTGYYPDVPTIDEFGCLQNYDLNLEIINFDISINNDTLSCLNDTVTIGVDVYIPVGVLFYDWVTVDGRIISNTTNAEINVDLPGTYEVLLSATYNGLICDTTVVIIVDQESNPPTVDAGPDGIIDCTMSTFTLDGSASDQNNPFVYAWVTADGLVLSNDLMYTTNAPGTYIFTVLNSENGCMASDTAIVIASGELPLTDAGADGIINCLNESFTLDGSASEQNANLTYSWQDTFGVNISTNLISEINNPGIYILTIINNTTGCINRDSVHVADQRQAIAANAGIDGVINCRVQTFTLDGSASEQGANFEYAWQDTFGVYISSNLMHNINNEGIYILTITDNTSGCIGLDSVVVSLDTVPPIADAGTDRVINCLDRTADLDGSDSDNGPPIIYIWHDALGNLLADQNMLNVSDAGWYFLTVTDTISGCMHQDSVLVTEILDVSQFTLDPDLDLPCGTTEYDINPTLIDPNPSNNYLWTSNDGTINSDPTMLNIMVTTSGTYIMTVTNSMSGCTYTDSIKISFPLDFPLVDILPADTLTCVEEQINIQATFPGSHDNVTFNWSSPQPFTILNDTTIQVSDSGWYFISAIQVDSECMSTDSIFVHSNMMAPVAHAGQDTVIICSDIISLDGRLSSDGNQIRYDWTTMDGHIVSGASTLSPIIDQAGSYTLVVTNINNGCTDSDTVVITSDQDLPEVVIDQTDTLDCNLTMLTLIGDSPHASVPITYLWSTVNGQIISDPNQSSIDIDQPGIYNLQVVNTTTNCSNSTQIEVFQDTLEPMVYAGPDFTISCSEPTAVLQGRYSDAIIPVIAWTTLDGNIQSGEATLNPMVDQSGLYVLMITGSNGCTAIDTAEVSSDQAVPIVSIAIPDTINCRTDQIELNATASSQGANISASWYLSQGSFIDTSDVYKPRINSPGIYILEIVNVDNDCTIRDTVTVIEDKRVPEAEIRYNDITCFDTLSILDATKSTGAHELTYLWTGPSVQALDAQSPLIETDVTGTYTLEVTDVVNGCTDIVEATIDFIEDLNGFSLSLPSIYTGFLGQLIPLNASINFDSTFITSIIWADANTLKNGSTLNPTACPLEDTDYTLSIWINDLCQLSASTRIEIEPSEVFIPNIFTPNGDGTNDSFTIYGSDDIEQIDKLIIANRWGDLVFQEINFQPNNPLLGWDGRFKNTIQNPGVYVYYVEIRFISGETKFFTGDVTLMR